MAARLQPASETLRRQRLAGLCIALVLMLLSVQAVHVHATTGSADTTCLVCVSARSSAPMAAVITLVILVALASLPVLRELTVPSFGAPLPLFIRPPPAA